MQNFLLITKALSDENRVRVLMALSTRELCVCQITELLNLAPSTVSKHMSILKQARLAESEKSGKWVYYRLADRAPKVVQEAIDWVKKNLVTTTTIKNDAKKLKLIIKKHTVEGCKKQTSARVVRSKIEVGHVSAI